MEKKYWLIKNGKVKPATARTKWDGIESVLCLSESDKEAFRLARDYDRGLIKAQKVFDKREVEFVLCISNKMEIDNCEE